MSERSRIRISRRFTASSTARALADQICVHDEKIDDTKPLTIFDQFATWKTKTLTNFTARELLVPVFKAGKKVYESPTLPEIKSYCESEIAHLWDEIKRFENPHDYYVDLSQRLWDIKHMLLEANSDMQ